MKSGKPDSEQRGGVRILVVDDERRMIGFIRMNLELEGHFVLEAHNGYEALEVLRKDLPDIVLLDVMLPGLDGFEVVRRLLAEEGVEFALADYQRYLARRWRAPGATCAGATGSNAATNGTPRPTTAPWCAPTARKRRCCPAPRRCSAA